VAVPDEPAQAHRQLCCAVVDADAGPDPKALTQIVGAASRRRAFAFCSSLDLRYKNQKPALWRVRRRSATKTLSRFARVTFSCVGRFQLAEQRRIETDWDAVSSQMLARCVYRDPTNSGTGVLEAQTTYTYDPVSRNLLTRTQTDPSNANLRSSTHTYCSALDVTNGATTGCAFVAQRRQLDGPRTDVVDTMKYIYRLSDDSGCASNGVCTYRKGDLWKVTNALNQITEYMSYDSAGRVLRMKDANGVLTDMTYHARGWLQSRIVRADPAGTANAGDAITALIYDNAGQISRVTGPDGAYLNYTYDDAQRLKVIADNLGNSITYTLDAEGHRIAENTRDPAPASTLTRTMGRMYDSLGRLQKLLNAQNAQTVFTYDANGNQDTVTDALNRVTDHNSDPLNRLIQSTDALLGSTQHRYDVRDNLTQVIDAKNLSTLYVYNGFSDLIQLTSPDTGSSSYTYDSAGNRKTQTDARLVVSTYSYDALNRLTGIVYPSATNNIAFSYDQNHTECPATPSSERFGIGRLTGFTDPSGSSKLCYDHHGNVVPKIAVVNSVTLTTRWIFNTADRVMQLVYPSGTIANYSRDTLGRISAISVTPAGGSAQPLISAVSYYPFGPVKQTTWANGATMQRIYDLNYWISSINASQASGLGLNFSLDAVGNVLNVSDSHGPKAAKNDYAYDPLYRLSQFSWTPLNGENFNYDAVGNRTGRALIPIGDSPVVTIPYDYLPTSHRLDAVDGVGRSYDPNGNTVKRDRNNATAPVFAFDERNRYTSVTQPGAQTSYRYNARGERVLKNVNSLSAASRSFAYDESGMLLMEGNASGSAIQEVIWLDTLPVGLLASGVLYHVHPDHLGTPRKVIQPSTNIAIWDWPLLGNPFDELAPNQDPDGNTIPFVFNLCFPGQYFDAETGLHYNYFRDYEPGTGRYVERDPIGLRGGVSTYGYVGGNPFRFIDLLGLTQCDIDFALRFARENETDQTIPDQVHPEDLDNAVGRTWHPKDPKNPTPGELDAGMQNLLLETIIHEGQHIDQPDHLWRLPQDDPERERSHRKIRQSALDKANKLREQFRNERANSEVSSCRCK
jgi:RHS repeat-associated protein